MNSLRELIPTKREWKKWSKLAKLAAIGAALGVVGLLLLAVWPSLHTEPKVQVNAGFKNPQSPLVETMVDGSNSVQVGTLSVVHQSAPQRLLSVSAANRIIDKLLIAQPRLVSIEVTGGSEPRNLAGQLKGMFKEGGFRSVEMVMVSSPSRFGVHVFARTKVDAPMEAALRQMFKEIGQEPAITINPSLKPAELKLEVGPLNQTTGDWHRSVFSGRSING